MMDGGGGEIAKDGAESIESGKSAVEEKDDPTEKSVNFDSGT
jgi:hypothetical protein